MRPTLLVLASLLASLTLAQEPQVAGELAGNVPEADAEPAPEVAAGGTKAEQLAEIAITSAESHQTLTGEEPKIAMLSFSTMTG